MSEILVVYCSTNGSTEALAREVAAGVDSVSGMQSRLRTVPPVSSQTEASEDSIPDSGPPFADPADLEQCTGLLLGSPTRFGNMDASMKYFLDNTVSQWFAGAAIGKPAGVFTSSASAHGGQESTLLSMALPLLHHGMFLVGIPYSEKALSTTTGGGSPYGASHVSFGKDFVRLTDDERTLARALGKRVAATASRLESR